MHCNAKTISYISHKYLDLWVFLLYFRSACINKGKYKPICIFWDVFSLDQSWYFICALKLFIFFLFAFSGDQKALHVLFIQNTKAQML